MNKSLGKCLFCLYTLAVIVVIHNGVFVDSSAHLRFRRQSEGKCQRPEKPAHGNYIDLSNTSLKQQTLPLNTILWFNCDTGFKLSKEYNILICLRDGGWSQEPPTCSKLCAPLIDTAATYFSCSDEKGVNISCDKATDGASVSSRCAPFFVPQQNRRRISYCQDGSWNSPPITCSPVCGREKEAVTSTIVNGKEVKAGRFPWVAAIYLKTEKGFKYVCGGTMVTQKIIVTVAHCVSDDNGQAQEDAVMKVAVGKYYSEFNDERDIMAQYSDVQKVLVHPRYRGHIQRYTSDIAIVVTKDTLLMSRVVQPACIGFEGIYLTSRTKGMVAGWGYGAANNTPSEELAETRVSYIDENACYSKLPSDWLQKYYGYDKFCAGYLDGDISRCEGTSGNGLVFKDPEDGRFHLYGILSVGMRSPEECNSEKTFLYTKMVTHYEWLHGIIDRY